MLKKLLKYDLKYIYKVLIIFYILSIVFAFITRIFIGVDATIGKIIHDVSSGITITMMVNIVLNNVLRLWARYNSNIYGEESYLTHTLPIKKETIYNSKFLSSIITIFISVIVIGITIFIGYYTKDNFELFKNLLKVFASSFNSTYIKFIIVCLLIFFLEMTFMTQCGYTGIILGHKKNNNKIGFSILYSFIVYMLSQMLLLGIIYVIGLFNNDIMQLFTTNNITDLNVLRKSIYIAIITYSFYIVINYALNIKLFNKGVNIE